MSVSSVCGHWVWEWVVDKFYHDYTEVGGAIYNKAVLYCTCIVESV